MKNKDSKLECYIFNTVFVFLTVLLVIELFFSLDWRMVGDTALASYAGFLMDKFNFIPYKDIFSVDAPGAYFFHLFISKMFGYGDRAFRLVDIFLLFILSCITLGIMKPFGKRVIWASIVLFALSYLQHGPIMTLQRDYIGIIPVASAVLFSIYNFKINKTVRTYFIGLLIGASATIKPHFVIGLPVIVFFMLFLDCREGEIKSFNYWKNYIKSVLIAILGFASSITISILWIWKLGGLSHFIDIYSHYLPLYIQQTGRAEFLSGFEYLIYLKKAYATFGKQSLWLVPACLSFYLIHFESSLTTKKKRLNIYLASLAFIYSIYTVIAGQFFSYHWMPFSYFIILTVSFIVIPIADNSSYKRMYITVVFLFIIFWAIQLPPGFIQQARGEDPSPPRGGRVDRIAGFLKERLKPEDKVQALDVVDSASHAMLLSEAKAATPYLADDILYHNISDPYIQSLRKKFIARLSEERPRFIIHARPKIRRAKGKDTTTRFNELRTFIKANYKVAARGHKYIIYELI